MIWRWDSSRVARRKGPRAVALEFHTSRQRRAEGEEVGGLSGTSFGTGSCTIPVDSTEGQRPSALDDRRAYAPAPDRPIHAGFDPSP